MGIIRRAKGSRYTSISRQLLQDTRLSFEARGVAGYILSKPDDWEIQFSDIEREGGIGRDKRQRIFKELEDNGYFTRVEVRELGRIDYDYELHEEPYLPLPEKPVTDLPVPEKPAPENPVAVNNIELQNSEIQKSERQREEEKEKSLYTTFRNHFPDCIPSAFQQDQIYTLVEDEECWLAACKKWALNGWQPRKIEGLLELYQRLVDEKKSPPKSELSRDRVVFEDPCPYCSHTEAEIRNKCPFGHKKAA